MNETFDFDNDNIDLDSGVIAQAREYKLYNLLVKVYEEENFKNILGSKSLSKTLGKVISYIFDNVIDFWYASLGNVTDIWIEIQEEPYTSFQYEIENIKDFYDLAKKFCQKIYNESNSDFIRRLLEHLKPEFKNTLNEAFDFEDEEPDYDKDIKANLNRLKLYRKFKRLLHAEVDAIGNDIVNYRGLTELFTALLAYGFYVDYSTMNLTLGSNCDIKYYEYSRISSPTRKSFKLDIGIIEFDGDSESEILQNLKDGLDKIVNLIEKRKDKVYDDFLDRCMSNIWIDKFFRNKEKMNNLPYKFVDYINESLDFDDDSDLDNSVKDLADFYRRKERLVNELYKDYGRSLNKPEQDLPKVNGKMILPSVVRRFTNQEFSLYQSYINSDEYILDDANGNWVEFELPEGIKLLEALNNMAEAIYSSGNDYLINRIEKHLERYI